ncbi:hypothetical protein ANN_15881, partial [Periplaneta americana]
MPLRADVIRAVAPMTIAAVYAAVREDSSETEVVLNSCRSASPALTPNHRAACLRLAREWTMEEWSKVLFSDESWFSRVSEECYAACTFSDRTAFNG